MLGAPGSSGAGRQQQGQGHRTREVACGVLRSSKPLLKELELELGFKIKLQQLSSKTAEVRTVARTRYTVAITRQQV